MPPRTKITKEDIAAAALELTRRRGPEAVNARELAKSMNCSTQPVFSNYPSMEELRKEVLLRAENLFWEQVRTEMTSGTALPYKASGLAYIRFAREERHLFRLLFMRDRSGEPNRESWEPIRDVLDVLMEKTGLNEADARRFHLEMWSFVHGIAVMQATGYLDLSMDAVSDMLSDVFDGLCRRFVKRS